ncbi:MAG TPA: ACT domain-containing protein [Mycobacteriales bacterium]|nr:ACT domain-containing protein [Mycobacteriales bacterium]
MPAHLRVSVADRPGSLAALAAALARVGANVLSVTVLEREQGRAVDDLLVEWPHGRPWEALTQALDDCRGLRVHGMRQVAVADATSDVDLIRQDAAEPGLALETAVDGLPHVLLADWAAAFDRRTPQAPALVTHGAPTPLPETARSLERPRALTAGPEALLLAAVPGSCLRVLVGRYEGPGFTGTEVQRCAALLDVTATILQLTDNGTATRLTGRSHHAADDHAYPSRKLSARS